MLNRVFAHLIGGGGGAVFDPATLALSFWEREYAGSSPWSGTASAGVSGAQSASGGTPPSAGTALNGHATADFNGSSQTLSASSNADTYYTNTTYSGWALVRADTVPSISAGSPYSGSGIVGTFTNSIAGVSVSNQGAQVWHYDTAYKTVTLATFATAAYFLIQWKYDGTNLKARLNSDSWTSVAATSGWGGFSLVGNAVQLGQSYTGVFFDGRMAELALSKTVISDADFDNVKSYVNSRYALSL